MKKQQKEASFAVLQGKDVFVRLPMGYGKMIITAVHPKAFDTLRGQLKKRSTVICICPLISRCRIFVGD